MTTRRETSVEAANTHSFAEPSDEQIIYGPMGRFRVMADFAAE
jgi:hypothetical protein